MIPDTHFQDQLYHSLELLISSDDESYTQIHLLESLQSLPMKQPIPITAASIIHLSPIEQWDPILSGMNFEESLYIGHGCRTVSSPMNVYF